MCGETFVLWVNSKTVLANTNISLHNESIIHIIRGLHPYSDLTGFPESIGIVRVRPKFSLTVLASVLFILLVFAWSVILGFCAPTGSGTSDDERKQKRGVLGQNDSATAYAERDRI